MTPVLRGNISGSSLFFFLSLLIGSKAYLKGTQKQHVFNPMVCVYICKEEMKKKEKKLKIDFTLFVSYFCLYSKQSYTKKNKDCFNKILLYDIRLERGCSNSV